MEEKAKTPDNAVAYRGFLTHYAAKISLFKEIHPYLVWALLPPFVFSPLYVVYENLIAPINKLKVDFSGLRLYNLYDRLKRDIIPRKWPHLN